MTAYSDRHVVILGLARQGAALARFFCNQGAQVTISDIAPADQLSAPLAELAGLDVRLVLGGHPLSLLDGCQLLCLSGGVPPQIPLVRAARRQGIPLSNDTLLTLELCPAPAVGITGSSGKTTVTTLVGLMLAAGGYRQPGESAPREPTVWVGGNIGLPLIDRLDRVQAIDWLVLELSSFQLELFDPAAGGSRARCQVASVLNITPNHLDRHPSMAHYAACKANLLRWQRAEDVVVLDAGNPITGSWLQTSHVEIEAGPGQEALSFSLAARTVGFGLADPGSEGCWLQGDHLILRLHDREHRLLDCSEVALRGQHNLLNVMAACATAGAAGVETRAMVEVARTFRGVPHRLELVCSIGGVDWVNDSIATTPERAVAALCSYEQPIVLLAGGRDKKLPWEEFAVQVHQRVRHLILFGEAAGLIEAAVQDYQASRANRAVPAPAPGFPEAELHVRPEDAQTRIRRESIVPAEQLPIHRCTDLAQAVAVAHRLALAGDVVLLAPGGTSFDAYKDFEARGRHFRELVNQLDHDC